eukprot:3232068-Prymnesium_polylepis.1
MRGGGGGAHNVERVERVRGAMVVEGGYESAGLGLAGTSIFVCRAAIWGGVEPRTARRPQSINQPIT